MHMNIRVTGHVLWLVGLLLFFATPAHSAGVTYQYDAKHRLIGATYDNGAAASYSYDGTGNRTNKTISPYTSRIYEDAEDGTAEGWYIYDGTPDGAVISNVYDNVRSSRVIDLYGSGSDNGYELVNADGTDWNDVSFKVIEWSMQYEEWFTLYIAVQTKDGPRYLYYDPENTDYLDEGEYIHHGLGSDIIDGTWRTFERDLEYDLQEAQPNNELEAVDAFLIRGSGRVDDIILK